MNFDLFRKFIFIIEILPIAFLMEDCMYMYIIINFLDRVLGFHILHLNVLYSLNKLREA